MLVDQMFSRKPQLPVSPEQQEWIEKSFVFLTELFGEEWIRNAPLVLPSEKFFPKKWEATEAWASFAFDRVCELMKVHRERVELHFVPAQWVKLPQTSVQVGPMADAAGLYREVGNHESQKKAQIVIKGSKFGEPERMVAVMSHELAHVLLLGDGKIERDFERMEPLTDLMTVFSGFGVFTANAAHVHKSSSRGWSVSRTGYLSPREFGYALAVFAWIRGEHKPTWDKDLSRNVRTFMGEALAHFKASKRA